MSWTEILGQDRIALLLQRAIVEHRLPHAILLSGTTGIGKTALAVELARVTNCFSPIINALSIDACGMCRSCLQMRTLQHPNLRFVYSLPTGATDASDDVKAGVIEDIKHLLDARARDPYHQMRIDGATQIRIGQVRSLKKDMVLSSAQSGRQVVVVCEAHEMTAEAANAFLKTLEEPHANVTIILTSSRPERLLPTIVSRCQELVCPAIDDDVLIQTLVDKGHCTPMEARLVVPFANGSWTTALSYLGEDMAGNRAEVVELLRTALRGRDMRPDLVDRLRQVSDGRNKQRIELMLTLLIVWLRDASIVAAIGPDAPIQNADQREAIVRFAGTFGSVDLGPIYTEIDRAVGALYRNVTPILVLLPLLITIRKHMFAARLSAATA